MVEALLERVVGQRGAAHERLEKRKVAEVREDRPVARYEELFGVVSAEAAGVHLLLEEAGRPLDERLQGGGDLDAQTGAVGQRLTPEQPDEVVVLAEEAEGGG